MRLRLPFVSRWSMGMASRSLRALAAEDPYAALLEVTPVAFLSDALSINGAAQGALANGSGARGARDERLRHAAMLDRDFYLRSDLLPKLDVATMAAQVEGRCPFLDGDVARALDAMPPMQRFGKAPLRSAYAATLPHDVFAQRKRGFALPLDRWFRGELAMLDLLRDQRTRQRAHVQASGLDRAIDLHRARRADLGRALYLVAAYETWLRTEEAR
jgi:asparagine synthase (glutamine-hydrolysing)